MVLDQFAQKICVIALGDYPRKVDYGVGHRVLLEQPQTTKKRGGHQPGRALRGANGFARGLLHHGVGHNPQHRLTGTELT